MHALACTTVTSRSSTNSRYDVDYAEADVSVGPRTTRTEINWKIKIIGKLSQFLVCIVYVKYTSICIAHFYAKHLKCAQTRTTQFYLQITPCLPLLPSRRTSPPFGWYSFYRPTDGRRLSRPGWLVTYRNKVQPPGVEPGHVYMYNVYSFYILHYVINMSVLY